MDHTNSNLPSETINFDEISNNAISHKPSIKSYAAGVFQESTVGIVSSIFTTHSKYRRFFKVFLSSLCIAGFMYHCATFMNHVLGYPEVVDIFLDKSEYYNWPAYTYCSNKPIRRSVFCDMYPEHCAEPSEEFCKKFSSFCGDNTTLVSKTFDEDLPGGSKLILEFGSVPNVLLPGSDIYPNGDEISGPFLRYHHISLMPCYSIHSRVEINQKPLQKKRRKRITFSEEFMWFYINETEMMNPKMEPGVYFSVHSPFEDVNPFDKGIFLKSGRRYNLYVEMEQEILLKHPFESNCMDYEELWEKNNHTGPRTKMMCREKCSLEYSLDEQGCTYFSVLYPNKERICGNESSINFTTPRPLIYSPITTYEYCLENCRDECRSSRYITKLEMREQDVKESVKDEEDDGYISMRIYLSNEKVKVLRHSPKYETVDVISSVGGFMGCWLGIALMDILDVFGSIISICGYPFRKKLPKKIKRRQFIAAMEKSTE